MLTSLWYLCSWEQLNKAKEQTALSDLAAKEDKVEKKEKEFNKEAADKEQELSNAGKDREESDFVLETSAGDGIEKPHVWTYVLVTIMFINAISFLLLTKAPITFAVETFL